MTLPLFPPPPDRPRLAAPLRIPYGVRTSVRWGSDGYRLALEWRREDGPLPAVIGLNPSAASDIVADRTLLRLLTFLPGGFTMLNLFALRATDPHDLLTVADPVGDDNNTTIAEVAASAPMIVCAWGSPPSSPRRLHDLVSARAAAVLRTLPRPLHAFGLTLGGHPRHPLYLPGGCRPVVWVP